MNTENLISIVIPLYNKESNIRNTVESILSQTYENIEVIVVDDGSTDNSIANLNRITDNRLRVFKKENGGPASARNFGVQKSRGHWIYFIDADDIICRHTLSKFADLISKYPHIGVFVANYFMKKGAIFKKHTIYMRNGVVRNNFRSWFWEILSPCQGATMYKRSILVRYPFPEHLRRWEDAAMFFEIMRNETIFLADFPAFTYNLDDASASHGRKDISEDFLGHLDMSHKPFWERMSFLLLYNQAKKIYPEQVKKIYGKGIVNPYDRCIYQLFYLAKWGMRILAKIYNTLITKHIIYE